MLKEKKKGKSVIVFLTVMWREIVEKKRRKVEKNESQSSCFDGDVEK
jgi:hypothetical protein